MRMVAKQRTKTPSELLKNIQNVRCARLRKRIYRRIDSGGNASSRRSHKYANASKHSCVLIATINLIRFDNFVSHAWKQNSWKNGSYLRYYTGANCSESFQSDFPFWMSKHTAEGFVSRIPNQETPKPVAS